MPEIQLRLNQIGKQFNQRWLFRKVNVDMKSGGRLALIGPNGSGKSTLLRIIGGQLIPTEGVVQFSKEGVTIPSVRLYQHVSWAAPYQDLYPELTLKEHIGLHFSFKKSLIGELDAIPELLQLQAHLHKPVRFFSSGMLQRFKAGLAIFSDTPLLLLDEPTSNLDPANAALVLSWLDTYQQNRMCILASNLEREYEHFPNQIRL